MPVAAIVELPALAGTGEFRSIKKETVADVTGAPVAELTFAPVPYVTRAVSALRKAPTVSIGDRRAKLADASRRFLEEEIGGLTRAEFERTVARTSGLGLDIVRHSVDVIGDYCLSAYERANAARPRGAVAELADPAATTGSAVWVRRGDVFGVLAAGNHPAVHTHWLEAVALGYKVAVRPSRREPLTAYRLVAALHGAGLREQVAYLPGDYDAADAILRSVDLAMVYGGDDVITKYSSNPAVLPQGPGRSKIIVTAGTALNDAADLIADAVVRGGGTGCTNTTGVLVDGDAAAVAHAVAERLSVIAPRRPEEGGAVLPVTSRATASRLSDYMRSVAAGSTALLGGDGVVADLGDGSAALTPAVHLVSGPNAKALSVELPFPCVWIAPWSPAEGFDCFDDTLAVSVTAANEDVVDALIRRTSVRNVYVGQPTYWSAPGVPHDGYLGDFLMESKGFVQP
ncbi:aldehyde dehydrogenase family protein [Microbacterium trichothecenolyticum]|uniref:aldehyde dehydrogenase family protein n=1 Tax=Microbacterium trichothecenolyticum TaxID=69370 RepID=UPI001C6F58B9|nr:aldehyde dehydrogenase family protein [Microbacterium trichothecenolyticum]MBW9122323.1 aldehyde dehydrogenase family protein [Microbacterium trichothecenolyticum]